MKNKKILIIVLIAILIIFFIFSVIFSLLNLNDNIISGISINNINISKMSKEEANSKLTSLIDKKIKQEIKLVYSKDKDNYEKNLDLSILNIDYNLQDTLNEAYQIGRGKNIFQNNFDIIKSFIFKKNIDLNITLDEKMLNNIINDISSNLPGKMVQSGYYIEDDTLTITKGKVGITTDEKALSEILNKLIANLSYDENTIQIPIKNVDPNPIDIDKIHSEIYKEAKDAYFEKEPFKVFAEVKGIDFDVEQAKKDIENQVDTDEIKIKLNYTEPKTKLKDLKINVFPDELGSFSTRYNANNEDRSTNLNLAATKIDGTILSPGEEFSYNKIVGERTISAGYKEAKVYQNGEVVDGIGGGICQISSTLYNAVVFANLEVTQRYNHQFITSYVEAGRDATVAYGSKDFKFVNNRTYPIRIDVYISSGIAKVDIYGIKEKDDKKIDFEIENVSNIPYDTKYQTDSSLPAGTEKVKQRGANGIIVNAYKIVQQNGITVSKELLSKDTYKALDRVILKSSN